MTYRIIFATVAIIICCGLISDVRVWADTESLSGGESVSVEEGINEDVNEDLFDLSQDQKHLEQSSAEAEDPLEDVAKVMNEIRRLMEELQTGTLTQQKQRKAISMLTELIEIAKQQQSDSQKKCKQCTSKKQCKRCASQQQKQSESQQQVSPQEAMTQEQPQESTKGMPDEKGTIGTVKGGTRRPATAEAAEWGNLPPRLREEVLQALEEDFPLRYKSLLRQYYKTLSEEE